MKNPVLRTGATNDAEDVLMITICCSGEMVDRLVFITAHQHAIDVHLIYSIDISLFSYINREQMSEKERTKIGMNNLLFQNRPSLLYVCCDYLET